MAETQTAAQVRLREYETVFLVKPELSDEGIERIKERIRTAVNGHGGKVLKFTNWGKKKTAFVVGKQPRAIYVHVNYLAKPGLVAEVERNLAIAEDVTKYMSQRLADDVDPETRQVEPDVKLAGDADERPPRPEREGGTEERGERVERAAPAAAAEDVEETE